MMPPILSSYLGETKELFIRLINQKYDSFLKASELDVSLPVAGTGTHTHVRLTPYASSTARGVLTLSYNRWDLSQFFYGTTIATTLDDTLSITRICQEIEEKFKVSIDPDDIEPIDLPTTTHPAPLHIVLNAKSTSLLWTGSLEVWGLTNSASFSIFEKNMLSFNGAGQKNNAYLYSVDYDLTGVSEELRAALLEMAFVGTYNNTTRTLVSFLKQRTGEDWVISRQSLVNNLFGAQISEIDGYLTITLGNLCRNLYGGIVFGIIQPVTETVATDLNGFDSPYPLDTLFHP